MIVSIETSTTNCSVALHNLNGDLIAIKERDEGNIHASMLFLFIDEIIKENASYKQLKAIAVSKGPGSYTGLRIGVSAAKGLGYSLGLPLISVNTLKAMALMQKEKINSVEALLVPMLDARRMEAYNAVYDKSLNEIIPTRASIINEETFREFSKREVYFFGDGMPKSKDILSMQQGFHFIDSVKASASGIGIIAAIKYKEAAFEDLAYFEPFYLKEFVTQSTFQKK